MEKINDKAVIRGRGIECELRGGEEPNARVSVQTQGELLRATHQAAVC